MRPVPPQAISIVYGAQPTPNNIILEYGNSCMGYEIAGGIGAKMADPGREVYVVVGDASYLMMPSEIVTSVSKKGTSWSLF